MLSGESQFGREVSRCEIGVRDGVVEGGATMAGHEIDAGLVAGTGENLVQYSLDLCQFADGAGMEGGRTTGYRRRVRGAEIGAGTVCFAFGIISGGAGKQSQHPQVCVWSVFTADRRA